MKTKTPELLPCPFCGGKAEFINRYFDIPRTGNDEWGAISCMDCGCELVDLDLGKEALAETWNSRSYAKPRKLKNGCCPACGNGFVSSYGIKDDCCFSCGQRLDWS